MSFPAQIMVRTDRSPGFGLLDVVMLNLWLASSSASIGNFFFKTRLAWMRRSESGQSRPASYRRLLRGKPLFPASGLCLTEES